MAGATVEQDAIVAEFLRRWVEYRDYQMATIQKCRPQSPASGRDAAEWAAFAEAMRGYQAEQDERSRLYSDVVDYFADHEQAIRAAIVAIGGVA